MNEGGRSSPAGKSFAALGLATLAFVPIVLFATCAELWAPDEPRYAEVAREAFEGGGLLVMHLNGEVYPDKPPLLYWLAGAAGKLGGWSELALRLPSLLATLGTAWIAGRLARRWWGEREGALAPLFFLSTVMVGYIGGRLQIDPLLAFFSLAAIDLASGPQPRMGAAGACAGLGALCKGPVAWLHVLLALLAWRLLPSRARAPIARPARAWIAFGALAVLPVLAWALAASAQDPSLRSQLLWGQHVGRAVEGTSHAGPPWYYLLDVPLQLLPWTPLFLAALARAFREWKRARRGEESDAGLLRAAAWFAVVFVLFSILPNKRALYLLPIYPAAALCLAREMAIVERGEERGEGLARWVRWGSAGLLLLAGLALCAVAAFPSVVARLGSGGEALESLDLFGWRIAIVGAPLAIAGAVALLPRLPVRAWTASIAIGFALAASLYALVLVPAINPAKSPRAIAEWLAARPEKPAAIACYGVRPEGYRFYGGVPAVTGELAPALEREGKEFLGLIDRKHWDRMDPADRDRFRVLLKRGVGSRDVVVLGSAEADR